MRLGVDFGTTNSSVGYFDGETLHAVLTDSLNDNPYVMPSLIYIDRAGKETVGTQAANLYLRDETGRPIRWRRRIAGEIKITVASVASVGGEPIEFSENVNVLVDSAARGRLLQSIKTALFNPRYDGTRVFSRYYRIETLIAIVLRELRQATEQELSQPCREIVLGRPVRFSDNPYVEARAESILFKAAHLAGFEDVVFALEPVGVAYLHHRESRERKTCLVFDFGGGTLDLTLADVGGALPPQIRATGGVQVGGDDLDRRLMELLLPYFGAGPDGPLPQEMSDKLRAWQTMPELSRPAELEQIRRLRRNGYDRGLQALETLVTRNLGFKLFKEIERVKKMLSSHDREVLRFEHDAIQIAEPITRRRFERLIASEVDLVIAGVESILAQAGLQASQVDLVLRTGGSSQIPAFSRALESLFGAEKLRAIDPLVSVMGGFAVLGHETTSPPAPDPMALLDDARHEAYTLVIGARCFGDRDYVIDRLPVVLHQLPALRLYNTDKISERADYLRFSLREPARVYVAYDADMPQPPAWLADFRIEPLLIEIEDSFARIARSMQVYSRDYPAGEVVLGGAQAAGFEGEAVVNYLLLARPLPSSADQTG